MAINEVTSIDVKTLPPFKRLIMTLGELPTSYLESMTYAELLMWFCNFLQEKVLPTIDNNAEALQDVITYLENLDLQDEVDHKLDEMTEEGTLQEIIADYLNSKAVFGFDNVASMKSATNLIDGSYARTLGFYNKNDGGSALYKIRKITNDDVVDESIIIALADETLIAEYIVENNVNVLQLGIKNDGETNVSSMINNVLTKFKGYEIHFPKGTYLLNTTLYVDANTTLKGDGKNSTIFITNNEINMIELKDSFVVNVSIENIGLNGNYHGLIGIYFHKTEYSAETVDMKIRLEHLDLLRFTDWCIKIGGETTERVIADSYYNDITCHQFTGGGILLTNRCTDSYFNNIRVGGGSVATKENIVVRGYNLHFTSCKSFYSGTEETPKDAWLFEGCGCLYGEIEAQNSTHYGVQIKQCNAFNLTIMADRCTLATDTLPAVYMTESHYGSIKLTASNYEGSTQFECTKGIQIYNCYNINLQLFSSIDSFRFIEMITNDNSYNINYEINGFELIDITPEFNTINYSDNGVTVKSVGNNQLLVQGTTTAQVDIDLKGNYGASAVLTRIPKLSVVKYMMENEYTNDVVMQVFNVTTVLVGKSYSIVVNDNETNITGIKIRIPSGKTVDKIISPRIYVIRNSK